MKITLVTVGKIKEKYYTAAIEEYSKRMSRYCTQENIKEFFDISAKVVHVQEDLKKYYGIIPMDINAAQQKLIV